MTGGGGGEEYLSPSHGCHGMCAIVWVIFYVVCTDVYIAIGMDRNW